jgi:hypothetical protein
VVLSEHRKSGAYKMCSNSSNSNTLSLDLGFIHSWASSVLPSEFFTSVHHINSLSLPMSRLSQRQMTLIIIPFLTLMHILWKSIEIHEKRHENHNSQSFFIIVTSLSNTLQKHMLVTVIVLLLIVKTELGP